MLLVGTPIIKSMANEFIYSPNSRLTKFRQACNLNTKFYARGGKWSGDSFVVVRTSFTREFIDIGYIYYDTDSDTSSGFIFVTRAAHSIPVQNFKQVCFSSCLRLFRIGAYTYYKVDATDLLHGKTYDKS